MRVARTLSFEETRVEEAPVPSLQPGDALVEVEACGLCGSDALRWYVERKAPAVLGHEPAGVVVETGAGCALSVGQRVFMHHHVSCGACPCCRRGAETSCELFRRTRLDPGGFAERVRVPAENARRDTLVLPDSVSFEQATFIEPVACCARAVGKLGLRPDRGETVLVIGLGAMGLVNARLAKALGAARVIGSELSSRRAARGAAWGVDLVLDPRAPDFAARLREETDGGPDHVIVGPATEAAVLQGVEAVAPGGTVCLFTPVPPGEAVALPLTRLYFDEVRLVSSYSCSARETRLALGWIREGVVPVGDLISHRLTLSQVGEGIRRTAAAGDDWLRAVVLPQRRG